MTWPGAYCTGRRPEAYKFALWLWIRFTVRKPQPPAACPTPPRRAARYELAPVDGGPRPLPLTVRRSHLLEDAVAQLGAVGSGIKRRLRWGRLCRGRGAAGAAAQLARSGAAAAHVPPPGAVLCL